MPAGGSVVGFMVCGFVGFERGVRWGEERIAS
jgi:hypothetical protein